MIYISHSSEEGLLKTLPQSETREITLWIEIDQDRLVSFLCKFRGCIKSECRFSDTALIIEENEFF